MINDATQARTPYDADSGLALVADPENNTVNAALTIPEGNTEWDSGCARIYQTMQTRGAVLARVRRFLVAS